MEQLIGQMIEQRGMARAASTLIPTYQPCTARSVLVQQELLRNVLADPLIVVRARAGQRRHRDDRAELARPTRSTFSGSCTARHRPLLSAAFRQRI
jgi:hypothetical protein